MAWRYRIALPLARAWARVCQIQQRRQALKAHRLTIKQIYWMDEEAAMRAVISDCLRAALPEPPAKEPKA